MDKYYKHIDGNFVEVSINRETAVEALVKTLMNDVHQDALRFIEREIQSEIGKLNISQAVQTAADDLDIQEMVQEALDDHIRHCSISISLD